jgi:hypothetical protein
MWCRCAYLLAVTGFGAFADTPCEQLKMLKLSRVAITLAESKAAGPFENSGKPAALAAQMLPAHCRVAAKSVTTRPTPSGGCGNCRWSWGSATGVCR